MKGGDKKEADDWRVWDEEKEYGEVLFKRATGESPEMESSKAAAKQLIEVVKDGDEILDVGCAAGHYLRSLKNALTVDFSYTGVDATAYYIELAKKAFKDDPKADFKVGDIFNLPFEDNSKDVVMCNNVFLHLPSIKKPLSELCRVARRFVLVRSMVGD
ncbi:class I SAM-dependent methyltransferase, partial [Kaarinaea lacus]